MVAVERYLHMLPEVLQASDHNIWLSYDVEAAALYINLLYINFREPSEADDAELTDDDVMIVRYARDGITGCTILHASKRTL